MKIDFIIPENKIGQTVDVKTAISEKRHGPMNLLGHLEFDDERRANQGAFLSYELQRLPLSTLVVPRLTHGTNIECISQVPPPAALLADGLLTDKKGIFLSVGAGDCFPVYFYDRVNNVIGIAHCGWRGVVAKLPAKMIERMAKEYNSHPSSIMVYIGPGVQTCHFEIGPDVAAQFGWTIPADQKLYYNLSEEITAQLVNAGVSSLHIFASTECTYCENEGKKYYSYRRDRSDPLMTNMAVIGML